jgi:protease I
MSRSIFLLLWLMMAITGCKSIDTPSYNPEGELKGMRVAVVVTDGFEQSELAEPKKALEEAGALVTIISPKSDNIQGYKHDKKSDTFVVDLPLSSAKAENFDALLLPGGVKNPDQLRLVPEAIKFIKDIGQKKKPIAAICHGPWTLIDAGLVKGHKVTSWPSLKVDLQNAGAQWVDEEVVVSKNLVTSRKPDDIPAFNRAMIQVFLKHRSQKK